MAARASAVAALGMLAAAPGAAYAAPDDTPAEATGNRAELGGGSGIVLGSRTKCTLTTIGHDNAGRLVGFTAGHCAEAGTPVRGEQFPDVGVVGVVVSADEQLDYGVIEFDPNVVTPLRSVGGTTITGIGPSPAPWSVVCQNGRTTGNSCGVVWTSSPMAFMEQACSSYGDSGGPLTVGDRLVGLVSGPLINDTTAVRFSCSSPANPIHTPVIAIAFDTVRAAVDAGKGVGAGFQPI
ncbi:hypothetical protein JK358_27770 [Nocardia sp. 2]|uniref:Serine protease n=1 Tax=Nocardia acididurans TaxID=2802282 RepID=A0ABS1MC67_9NOCA|nr:hypothetical protein [Nocardia acididurans]MBL1078212.1 hypothetical protein [Nocardia acididurans]